MTERSPLQGRLLSSLRAPRSIRLVLILSLLLFLVVPFLLGYYGYTQYQNYLESQINKDLNQEITATSTTISQWQKSGADRVELLSMDPDVVDAAFELQLIVNRTTSDAILTALIARQSGASPFTDMAVVNSATNNIVVSTSPAWTDQPFPTSGGAWTFPYAHLIVNQKPFGSGLFLAVVASPIRSASRQSGFVLVGFLNTKDLATILGAASKNSSLYLVDSSTKWKVFHNTAGVIQAFSMDDGQFSVLNNLSLDRTPSYINSFNKSVFGIIQQVYDPETRLVAEMDTATAVDMPLADMRNFGLMVFSGILIALLLVWLSFWVFVIRPMTRLTNSATRLASGHLEEPRVNLGTSEHAALASALSKIMHELRNVSQFMGAEGQNTARQIMTTVELTRSLSSIDTVDHVLTTVLGLITDRLRFDFASIYLTDEAGQFAILREATGLLGVKIKEQGQRFPLGSYTIIGSVAQTGRPHNSANTAEDPMYVRHELLGETRSEAAVAIRADRRIIGVLDVRSFTSGGISPEDMDLLQTIADQTGIRIENVKVIEAANLNTEISQQLFRTSRMISMVTKPEEIYQAALEGLKGTAFVVSILIAENDALSVKGFFDPANPQMEQPPTGTIGDSPETLSRLLQTNQPMVLKVLSELSRVPPHMRQFLDSLNCRVVGFLPLRQGERLFGAIMLSAHDESILTMARVRAYMPVVEQILIAVERLDLFRSTQDRLNELITLNRISQSVSQALDLDALFGTVQEQIKSTIGECDVIFAIYEQNRDLLNFPYAYLGGQRAPLDSTPLSESLYATVIRTGQPLMLLKNLEERAAALGVHIPEESLKSWLGIPLISANQVVGVMTLRDTEHENRFNENDLRLMATIGAQIASTIRTSTLLLESERKAIQLQTAAEIARETIGLLDLDRLLTMAVNLIRDRFGFYHSSVFLLDEERKFAVLNESTGEAGRQMKARGHKLGVGSQSIVGWVTQNARPRVADDVTADPMHRPNPLLPATRAELGIPMKIGETVVGALDIQSTLPYAFTPDDIAILQVIADQITIAVENARLFGQTRQYLARHQSLYQVTATAAASTTVDAALHSAAQGLHDTMPGSRIGIFLLNPEKDSLVIRAHSGFTSHEIEKLHIPLGQGVPGWVAINRQPSLVSNTATDSRYFMIDPDVQSELSIPLIHRDELLGVLDTQSSRPDAFTEDDVQLLGTVASLLSAILSSTLLFEQVTQERERLRHLYEEAIGMAGPPAGSMESLLRNAIERVRNVSGADCVAIAFPSEPEEARIDMCTCEPHFQHLSGTIVKYGQDVIGKVFSTSQVVHYAPAIGEGEVSKTLAQVGIKAALALPLQWSGRMLGTLLVSRMTSERGFTNEETQLISLLALQMAATIESARLFDQTRRQAEREHMLFEITSRIRRSVDVQGILSTTASELSKALGARRATISIGNTGIATVESDPPVANS
jgi:GAF domain-containing protein